MTWWLNEGWSGNWRPMQIEASLLHVSVDIQSFFSADSPSLRSGLFRLFRDPEVLIERIRVFQYAFGQVVEVLTSFEPCRRFRAIRIDPSPDPRFGVPIHALARR